MSLNITILISTENGTNEEGFEKAKAIKIIGLRSRFEVRQEVNSLVRLCFTILTTLARKNCKKMK